MNVIRALALACFTALIMGCERKPPVIVRATVAHVYSSAEWIDLHLDRGFEPQKDDGDQKVEAVVILRVTVEAASEDAALTIANYWTQISKPSCITQPNTAGLASKPCRMFGFREVESAFSPMTRAGPMRSQIVPSLSSEGHAVAEMKFGMGLSCSPEEFSQFEFQLVAPVKPLERDFRSKNRSNSIDLPPFDSWKFESGSPMVKFSAPISAAR